MRSLAAVLFALVPAVAPGTARADVEKQLAAFEVEARQLATDLPQPNQQSTAQGHRRLVDAEVAYALGDHDTAALMLYDLASKSGPDQETATYYLAESLFHKGDRGGARTYFEQVATNAASRHYQASLIRLVEIAIALHDTTNVANHLAALDRIAPAGRRAEVPYVRGKFAFFEGKHDEALAYLNDVPKGSSHELQALYYSATAHVAKKDLARATELFTDLVARKPKTPNDRRVIELGHLALGRLYYERDQPSKSIDSYLMIDRKSDLFPDALYEVAWVYVKGKQYDKALRALELLALSEPTSQKTPTVRILEGNLRIRKAQLIRQAQITGTLDANLRDADPGREYDKAAAVFTETHDLYLPSYVALKQLENHADPGQYLAQLAGRSAGVFQATTPLPEAAAQYLREEPEVSRIVSVESDLGEVETHIRQAEATITRLEAVIAAADPTAVYPALQSRRARLGQMQDELIKIRAQLADRLVKAGGGAATQTRRSLVQQYQAMPSAEQAFVDRVEAVNGDYDKLEEIAAEVATAIDQTQAMAVALRKYAVDADPQLPADQQTTITQSLDEAAREAAAIEAELAEAQRELQLGRDLAGVGDEAVQKAREARRALKAAQDAEHRQLAGAGGDQKAIALADRAARVADTLAQTEAQIDAAVARGIEQVKVALVQERQQIASMKAELAERSTESREIGATVLAASFKDVKEKFYDIVIRTDVGNIDVAWSQKEDNDDDLKRLNLTKARELKQLSDEFRGVLQPLAEPPRPPAPTTPGPAGEADTQSPDKGTSERVKPSSEGQPAPAPVVRPDNQRGGTR
jgi:hypothetical protein